MTKPDDPRYYSIGIALQSDGVVHWACEWADESYRDLALEALKGEDGCVVYVQCGKATPDQWQARHARDMVSCDQRDVTCLACLARCREWVP